MIVRDIMATKLVTVAPDDTLGHAATLLRQYRFHHLPVTRTVSLPPKPHKDYTSHQNVRVLEGLLTAQDIDLAVAMTKQNTTNGATAATSVDTGQLWQERRVVEIMHTATIRVTSVTSVAAAAQMLVERGLNYLPVVEYEQIENETRPLLVGLVTRSDLLMALARAMGAFEPGMQLAITLPPGSMVPLIETLRIASELHMQVRSVIAAPLADDGVPHIATLRLGTINPTPLLVRLQEAGIHYSFANPLIEGEDYA